MTSQPEIILTPRILANYAADRRDYYQRRGWKIPDCGIGFDSYLQTVCLMGNSGRINYSWRADGHICRENLGAPEKLIEFVDLDCARYVDAHNQAIRQVAK